MEAIFFEISIIIIVGTVFASIAKFFKQPMIPAYILAGVILGPALFGIVERGELLETLSTFGIAFLLFVVGIELDLRKLLKSGKVAIIVGFAQMIFSVGIGYLIVRLFGFGSMEAFFLALALGFSSTIVVMKLLGERKEMESLYAQIVIGILLTQDFIAIIILIFFAVFTGGASGVVLGQEILVTILKGIFLFALALLSSRYILKHIFKYFARTPELLFLGAIVWNLILAIIAVELNFSIEVGSLLAGVSLSFLPYSLEIARKVSSLRDFFLPIFFAILGAQLIFSGGADVWIPTAVLSVFVLFVSPVVVMGVLLFFGYKARTSFQAGVSIGQVSEFSFILVGLGYGAGIISQDIVAMVALIGLITMTLSTYMIEYTEAQFIIIKPFLTKFERFGKSVDNGRVPKNIEDHVVIFGYHTMGRRARQIAEKLKKRVLIVDYNPDVIEILKETKLAYLFGNLNDMELLEKANVAEAAYVVSTVPNSKVTLELLHYIKDEDLKTKVIVTAFHVDDALEFYEAGASFVLYPTLNSADFLGKLFSKDLKKQRIKQISELHILNDSNMKA